MTIFADTVLPFDLGLKDPKKERARREAAKIAEERQFKRDLDQTAKQQTRDLAVANLAASAGLLRATPLELAALEQQLQAKGFTPTNDLLAAAVAHALALKPRTSRDAALQHARAGEVPTVGLQLVVTPTGPRAVRAVSPTSVLGASIIGVAEGILPAPKRDGTTVGINKPIATAAGAVVDAITALERFTAANPADP